MKKALSFLLCLLLVLSLAACGEEAPPAGTTAPPSAAQIITNADSYSVVVGQMVEIKASVEGEEAVSFSYASDDETVATVNKYGKVVGVKPGTAGITVTASNGLSKTVTVTVEGPQYTNSLRVALNVLYNDTELGCYNTEYGPWVEIHEDGQYTVTFDATMNLSETTRTMGVTGLDNLTAIFIYDQAVRDGDQMASSVTACDIRWDKITVNGQELTITNSEFKSAIKASGIFDTNDPFNSWDGSAVEEVTVDTEAHVLNINVDDPVSVTVTFTIQGLTFAE